MNVIEDVGLQMELQENIIATAQRLLKTEKDKSKITPAFIAEKVHLATMMFAGDSPHLIDQKQAIAI